MTGCANPGRYGCGNCDACEAWADRELDARHERDRDDAQDRADRFDHAHYHYPEGHPDA